MTSSHPLSFDPPPRSLIRGRLFVLEDANGVTVACDGTMEALNREASRVPLLAPITVHDWYRTSEPTMHGGWKKREMFVWPSKQRPVG